MSATLTVKLLLLQYIIALILLRMHGRLAAIAANEDCTDTLGSSQTVLQTLLCTLPRCMIFRCVQASFLSPEWNVSHRMV